VVCAGAGTGEFVVLRGGGLRACERGGEVEGGGGRGEGGGRRG